MIIAGLVTVLAIPLGVYAGHRFVDVPDSNIFHEDIRWLADNGVTAGCNPPTNDRFCPDDSVTRGQMAAFMRRLAEGEVVAADTARRATFADDAETIDDRSREELLGRGGGNQQFRDERLRFSPPETLFDLPITTGAQGQVWTVNFSGFFVMTGESPTTTDHQFVCWVSPNELSTFNISRLGSGYWWSTYPEGSLGVSTSIGPQHAIPFSFTFARFVPPDSSVTLYSQCADLFADSAPVAEEFVVRGTTNAWAVPTDSNEFQPADTEELSVDPALSPSGDR